ncbi:hypothetical protein [Geomonas sp.]|uniref:Dyp-type peroxidase n=1 Tax=Geomonas sp. TaxID=2651584 RepID=UPI002B4701D7|nr:hypothetical protein [Geomonas sp.]HJV33651.1 hypothetical protein [Geomonas sp.]
MTVSPVDYKDIQGIVRFGYHKLSEACFLLLKIRHAGAARAWLAEAPVSTAETLSSPPETALQVAFSAEGLRTLGVPQDILGGFSPEFLAGMAGHESRSRRLGDVGANAPQNWQWGGAGKTVDLVIMLYAQPGRLQVWMEQLQTATWKDAFEVLDCLTTSDLDGIEPFGFADGISQPTIDWERQLPTGKDRLSYENLASLGEFLLGYPNEYGRYTDRPLLDPAQPQAGLLPEAEDVPDKRDLGRNGSYLVFRHLQQDVRGFWRFLDAKTGSDPRAREALAEKMVGRKMNGDPLVSHSIAPIEGVDKADFVKNGFTYDADPRGTRCPFGAHIRRANPRNPDLPGHPEGLIAKLLRTLGFGAKAFRDDVEASARFHRLLRRGREYGPGLSPEQAVADVPDTGEHGIHFICLAANILRQFEFVQNAWVMNTKFNALTEESDPLLGNREKVTGNPVTDTFSVPKENGLPERLTDLPQFVTVRGGGYFFLPSLSALRYFSRLS